MSQALIFKCLSDSHIIPNKFNCRTSEYNLKLTPIRVFSIKLIFFSITRIQKVRFD